MPLCNAHLSAFDPKADIRALLGSSKILSSVKDNGAFTRFGDAEDSRGRHKRNTPTTAKIHRPAAYATGSISCTRNVCFLAASGDGHFCISRLRHCYFVGDRGWHAHYFRPPCGSCRDVGMPCREYRRFPDAPVLSPLAI